MEEREGSCGHRVLPAHGNNDTSSQSAARKSHRCSERGNGWTRDDERRRLAWSAGGSELRLAGALSLAEQRKKTEGQALDGLSPFSLLRRACERGWRVSALPSLAGKR